VSRLEVMVSLANSNMQLVSVRQQIASAVHLLVQAARMSDGSRRVVNITEVTGMEGDVVTLQDIFVFEKRGLNPRARWWEDSRPRDPAEILREAAGGRYPSAPGFVRRAGGGLTRSCFWWLS